MTFRPVLLMLAFLSLSACARGDGDAYVGYVEAEYIYVAAPQPGWLARAPMREGDQAQEGDVLFALDTEQQVALRDQAAARAAQARAQADDLDTGARPEEIEQLEAQLADAEAQLEQAKSERDRILPLVERGVASTARRDQVVAAYESARARVRAAEEAIEVARLKGRDAARSAARAGADAAEAALAEAEWTLDQRTVKAKVGVRVEEVFHREGEFVTAGAPVLAILPPDRVKVRFFVPQSDLPGIEVGQTVRVRADGAAEPADAVITFVAGEAEFTPPVIYSADSRRQLTFLVEARLGEGHGLHAGLPVDVIVPERN